MKKWLSLLVLLVLASPFARAQFGSFGDIPIEINADSTQFIGGVAVAENNVVIRYGATTIYCDYAQYDPDTRDVLVKGNVRIYREGRAFVGERALYNLETKVLRAADFRGDFYPFQFAADTLSSLGANAFQVRDSIFTTSDSSKPDYYIKAKSVRIYPKDRIVFSNVYLYIGKTPVFWWPYLFQSLEKNQGFTLNPGYQSGWGTFLLTSYSFPINENMNGTVRLDLRSERGVAVGLDAAFTHGKAKESWGRFKSYYIHDAKPGTNKTALGRENVDPERYRVSLQDRLYITDDIYASLNVNKWSDRRVSEDFLRNEFRIDPQPDNVIALTKLSENYSATLIARKQLNHFFDMTERLPEFVVDFKRNALWNSPIFYEGETGVANLRRNFAKDSGQPDYHALRLDTFHQLLYPQVLGGWFSLVPRVGVRGTYYENTGHTEADVVETTLETILPDNSRIRSTAFTTENNLVKNAAASRGVVTAGFEASFKFSREFASVSSRLWGLDGLRHIVQPYTDFSFVESSKDPGNILQFDRLNKSTQLPIFDFPQFTSTDAITDWSVVRLGARNRLQTKRDNETFNWLELDTFFNVNINEPNFPGADSRDGTFSNVYNRLRWTPLPWVSLSVHSQLPLFDKGFTEVNSTVGFMANQNLRFDIGHRYIDGNPFFINSNLLTFGGYYRVNENWGLSLREQYEFTDRTVEEQRYEVHRDLSSWIASLGVVVRDNRSGSSEFGILLSFTLKDLPQVSLPFDFDPQGSAGSSK